MTADHPDRPRPATRTGTGRHRPVPPAPARPSRRAGDTGPTRRLREPRDPGARDGYGGPADRPERPRRTERRPGGTGGRVGSTAREVRLPWPDRILRGLAGILAGGMVVLALGLVVVWIGADRYGLPGPGADVVIGHLIGAALAVVGQRVADRRPDRTGTLAALVVVGIVILVLGFAWFL